MREISHRAKNMLSVVDASAHQTATAAPEDLIARFSERIQTLAANHPAAPFADVIGSRVVMRGPKLL